MSVASGQRDHEEGQPDVEGQATDPVYQDPDDRLLESLYAELENEGKEPQNLAEPNQPEGQGGDDGNPHRGDGVSDNQGEGANSAQPQNGSQAVPYARFQQVNQRRQQAEQRAASIEGQNELLRQQLRELSQMAQGAQSQPSQQGQSGQQQNPAQEPQPAEQGQINEGISKERQKLEEAAAKYDNGEIQMSEFVRVQSAVDDEVARLRSRQIEESNRRVAEDQASNAKTGQPEYSWTDQQQLARQAEQLEQQYPWTTVLEPKELNSIANIARQESIDRGQPYGRGAAEDARIRERVAQLSAFYGPMWHPEMVQQPGQQEAQSNGGQQQTQPSGPSETGKARQAKLNMAAQQPPNPNDMGNSKPANSAPSEAEIMNMSPSELEALDPGILERMVR